MKIHRAVAVLATVALSGSLLSGCSSGSGKPTLNWYINPDGVDTLTQIAEDCSTDDYTIAVQLLPSSATDQRTQLARRLAANDSSTDLMSLDPVFVAEFANAGWLQEVPSGTAAAITDDGGDYLRGAADTVVWNDSVYALPQWANTQVLWYRKSLAEAAGLDMAQPVTWDQIIDGAAAHNGTVGIQGNKYEAYVVLINALIQGAGGDIVSNTEAGREASVDIDSDAGRRAAEVIRKLAQSDAAQPDLSVSNEGTVLPYMFAESGAGTFMLNWTFVYGNYQTLVEQGSLTQEQFDDMSWARYPETDAGTASKPPIGGIDIGVGAFTKYPEDAMAAAECVTSTDAQTQLAVNEGLMPSTTSAYQAPELTEAYPADLLELFRTSVDDGGPRPKSAFYSMISSAVQARWHPPNSVNPDTTPQRSAEFLRDVLEGRALL